MGPLGDVAPDGGVSALDAVASRERKRESEPLPPGPSAPGDAPDRLCIGRLFGDAERDPWNWRLETTEYDSIDAGKNRELRPRPVARYCIHHPLVPLSARTARLLRRLHADSRDIERAAFDIVD